MMTRYVWPSAFDSYQPFDRKVYGCICISPANRILLVKGRHRHIWSFPKGHRDRSDRSALDCALRELKEETGFTPSNDYIACKRYKTAEYYIYSVPEEVRVYPIDTHEIEDLGWFTVEEIEELHKNVDVSMFCSYIQKKVITSDKTTDIIVIAA